MSTSEVGGSHDRVEEVEVGSAAEEERAEEELIRAAVGRAREGDTDAVRLLYTRFAPDVHRWVRHMLRGSHDVEEVTQTVFLKLIAYIPGYEERPDVPFSAWLRKVARNAALDHIRANQAICSDELEITCEDGAEERERARALYQALAGLPAEQREVVLLRHIRGLSPVEIAEMIGRSESAIHGLHHRGRHNLKASLIKAGQVPVVSSTVRPERAL